MSKRYVLLKDLPNVDAGAIFEKSNIGSTYFYGIPISADIPQTDQVGIVEFEEKTVKKRTDWFKEITDTQPVNDGVSHTYNLNKGEIVSVEVGGVKYLSPEEVLEREKKAFEAARGKDYFSTPLQESVINGFVYTTYKHKYPTFEDYKKAKP